MRTALLDAQFANVIVYTVNMSRMIATLTNKPYPAQGVGRDAARYLLHAIKRSRPRPTR
jgi:hypothetical protein